MRVINVSKNTVLAENARLAEGFFSRLKGLLGESGLTPGECLIIKPCDSIHTFFMRFVIDVAFVDKENKIIKIYACLKPGKLSGIFFNAAFCLELPSGTLSRTKTEEGNLINIILDN